MPAAAPPPPLPTAPPARRPRALTAATATAALLVLSAAGTATAVDRPTRPGKLTLISTAEGAALADAHGAPLYLREADRHGTPGCTGRCAALFPPAVGSPVRARGVTGEVTHTPRHAPGSALPQVVYAGHPLYYYAKDRPHHRPEGGLVDGFLLVAPDGTPLPPAGGEIGTATSRPERPAPTPPPDTRHHASGHTTSHPAAPPATSHTQAPPAPARTAGAPTRSRAAAPPAVPHTGAPPATSGTGAAPARSHPAAPTATPARSTAAVPAAPRTSPAAVGALQVTPSGAASGGAVHPVAVVADRPAASVAARVALVIGAAAAACAVCLVAVRRLRGTPAGGEH
ncbi:hypothetical protein [Streptomyces tremellae]|uniref:Lipoprotein n=1 Tax=Streptomyces tremellae TaxID=1124239 RepID=A0ABP7F0Z1_9ACTN